ncbi:restriction endonuclease subunit S [Streptomyces pratens]|uniref:Restriction endonuclease subunit S n=1 Tax=Streptomyces pratens TaxID=887456 RepID=A0ABW1LY30_9ACTN
MSTTVRLRHLAQINPGTPAFNNLKGDDELTFLPMEAVWPDNRLDISQRRTKKEVSTGYTRFQDGDILVPKITPTFEAGRSVLIKGLLGGLGTGTTELHVVRPGKEIDPKFLLYVANTHNFLKLGEAQMYGVAGQQRVPDSFLRDLPVRLPSLEEQRRIVSFLDTEIARIDSLSRLRTTQIRMLAERLDAERDSLFGGSSGDTATPLMHLTDPYRPIVYGIVQAGPEHPDGVPYIKTGDLKNLHPRSLSRTSPEIHRQFRRAAVHPGDLVMAMRASIGAVAIVPPELPEANLTQGTARIAAAKNVCTEWLYNALQTRRVQEQCDLRAVGSTFRTLNIWDLRRVVLWVPHDRKQTEIVAQFRIVESQNSGLANYAQHQIALLSERRQALITSAINGQFDVTTASGRNVTEGVAV